MTTAVANPEELKLSKFVVYSLALHIAVLVAFGVSAYFKFHGNEWAGMGGGGESTKVTLVSGAGIPMPKPDVVTDSQVVDPTKGLYKEEPQPKPPPPPPDATRIKKFEKEKPLPPSRPSRVFESKTPPPDNAVPYGKGGTPNIPTGYAQTPGASGGVAVVGAGGGDFASRYGWYVEAMKRRISGNWMQNTIDPAARASRSIHCVVEYRIARDGTVSNVRISQTSGNLSFDNSGLRAILGSNPMPPLPSDYSGGYVDVTFDFLPPGGR